MNKEIKQLFNQASEKSIITVAFELIEMVESHGVENKIRQDHIIALFCLERSVLYKNKGKLFMEAWLNAGYEYAESANVDKERLKFALSLLDSDMKT